MVRFGFLSAMAVAFCAVAAQANAGTYDFSYTDAGGDIVASGVITTGAEVTNITYPSVSNFTLASQNITNGGGQGTFAANLTSYAGFVITNITGTRNGQAITSLFGTGGQIAYTPAHNYIFDNLLYVGYAGAVPYVDLGGLEYTTGTGGNTQYFNVYTNPASNAGFTYFENLTALTKLSITQVSGGSPGSGVAPVPLPAALPLFGSAIAGLGGFNWLRRRRKDRSQA